MSSIRMDGKAVAKEIRSLLRDRVASLEKRGVVPGLAVILASDDPASAVYVRNKELACKKVGILSGTVRLEKDTSQEQLLETIQVLNADSSIHGILLQLPTYPHLRSQEAIGSIAPEKDVDGFHPQNAGSLFLGRPALRACTPAGCMELLHREGISVAGKHAVVIGRSNIVGKPMAMLLLQEDATVTLCHSKTQNLARITREADILVAAIGRPRFVTKDMVKPGAVLLDVGINRLSDGSLCGDVDESAYDIAAYHTPVPGGVGPMTIAMLCRNTVEAAEIYADKLDAACKSAQ